MKKGFTLVELLVVIVIIGALAALVLPGLVSNYTKGLEKIMKTQENLISDAANLAVKDYCNTPISNSVRKEKCKHRVVEENGKEVGKGLIRDYSGDGPIKHYICLKDLMNEGYYDNALEYEGEPCFSFVSFDLNENNKYVNPKTYIYCGGNYNPDDDDPNRDIDYDDEYDYVTDPNVKETFYSCDL